MNIEIEIKNKFIVIQYPPSCYHFKFKKWGFGNWFNGYGLGFNLVIFDILFGRKYPIVCYKDGKPINS